MVKIWFGGYMGKQLHTGIANMCSKYSKTTLRASYIFKNVLKFNLRVYNFTFFLGPQTPLNMLAICTKQSLLIFLIDVL